MHLFQIFYHDAVGIALPGKEIAVRITATIALLHGETVESVLVKDITTDKEGRGVVTLPTSKDDNAFHIEVGRDTANIALVIN